MSKIPIDKVYHFIAGLLIALTVTLLYSSPIYGVIAGSVAGLLKELYDEFYAVFNLPQNRFDFFDLFATILGSLTVIPIWEFLLKGIYG